MREAFHDQLDDMFTELAAMASAVQQSVHQATEALLTGDAEIAEQVISADASIDAARGRLEENAFSLLSLQQPVAGDLRTLISALRMVSELERMGDLSVHVAKIARLRVPHLAVPEDVRPTVQGMASVAEEMVGRVAEVILNRDVAQAMQMREIDEDMDYLRRTSFGQLLSSDWAHGVEAAVDLALLGRYYERIADHAVAICHRIVFIVTGENLHSPTPV